MVKIPRVLVQVLNIMDIMPSEQMGVSRFTFDIFSGQIKPLDASPKKAKVV
jgi:hypothetical protein